MHSRLISGRRLGRALIVITTLSLALAVFPALADTKTELTSAKARLDALIDQIDARQRSVEALQADASALASQMSEVQGRIAAAEERAAALRAQVEQAGERMEALQIQLDDRARNVYMNGPASSVEVLLGASSFADFSSRLEFVNQSQASDLDLVIAVENQRNALRYKQEEVRVLQGRLQRERNSLEARQRTLRQKLDQARGALAELAKAQAQAKSLVSELADKRQRELAAARLAAQQAFGGTPSGSNPLRICPVDPPRAFGNDFGAPRYGGGYHTHQGNDIFAPRGTPIRAPFPGTAVNATNGLGGLSVKVFGSQGYVYNAHMNSIGTLGSVSTGTVIGYVGDSGDAKGTSPHDHFEWHPGNGGAVNPYPYLVEVC